MKKKYRNEHTHFTVAAKKKKKERKGKEKRVGRGEDTTMR